MCELETGKVLVSCGRGAKAKIEPQPVSGINKMQHRRCCEISRVLKTIERGGHSPPHSDAPKLVRVVVSTHHKAKRLIPLYSRGSGDV